MNLYDEAEVRDRAELAEAIRATPKAGKKGRNEPLSPAERVAVARKIVAEGQAHRVEGVLVDLFSASVYTKVYDAVNETNKAKLAALPIAKGVRLAYRCIK